MTTQDDRQNALSVGPDQAVCLKWKNLEGYRLQTVLSALLITFSMTALHLCHCKTRQFSLMKFAGLNWLTLHRSRWALWIQLGGDWQSRRNNRALGTSGPSDHSLNSLFQHFSKFTPMATEQMCGSSRLRKAIQAMYQCTEVLMEIIRKGITIMRKEEKNTCSVPDQCYVEG